MDKLMVYKREFKFHNFIKFLFLIISSVVYSQNPEFSINEVIRKEKNTLNYSKDLLSLNSKPLFEDNEYIITSSCSGEWGGSIRFNQKNSDVQYVAESTCPIVVNKLNNKYFITNSLAHLSGFTQVLEIDNPDSMEIFKLPEFKKKDKGNIIYRTIGDDESKSTKGTRAVLDSIGVLTLISFPYKNQLYHITTDFSKTYLSEIKNGTFRNIATISENAIWSYYYKIKKTPEGGFYLYIFDNQTKNLKAYFDILNNRIVLHRFLNE